MDHDVITWYVVVRLSHFADVFRPNWIQGGMLLPVMDEHAMATTSGNGHILPCHWLAGFGTRDPNCDKLGAYYNPWEGFLHPLPSSCPKSKTRIKFLCWQCACSHSTFLPFTQSKEDKDTSQP